ncbi:DUF2580 domain-containing protein [Saccharomonospora xinjiangensis]|uniref:Excreted virulence factor EspC, type VII ESX diderm n=1 Tax=Saccharomonospora xinjiangensis XJ-54 TaxID=882086 RepID=I0UZ21_9PSEU|nr:DUF2580 domain-containing protein [Saccharomonospora xinjiangensis]EID53124.1 Protein of unknown function (DUF2580) [Saccharomonospora xinjiangensis XJ-54]
MTRGFELDPEVLYRGAARLDTAADGANEAANTAGAATGAAEDFGPSAQAQETASAWAALVKTRADEMASLASSTRELAHAVRAAADTYEQADSEHSEDLQQKEMEPTTEQERQRRGESQERQQQESAEAEAEEEARRRGPSEGN